MERKVRQTKGMLFMLSLSHLHQNKDVSESEKHCSEFYRKDRMESLSIAIGHCYKEWNTHKKELAD